MTAMNSRPVQTMQTQHTNEDRLHRADPAAYVWAYFTGEGAAGERISLAVSQGNDALSWRTLNGGLPILVSHAGTRGLRDPCIIRSHDGEHFYLLATDLRVAALHGDFSLAQCQGSRCLEVWESRDLVDWGAQRHVQVCPVNAGNAWAPEAHWVEELKAYAVYWASNLYDDGTPALRRHPTYNRMMICTTKDFRTFSPPAVWVDVPGGNGRDGRGTIDATVIRSGPWWYRFIKDERTMQVREERSLDLMQPVLRELPGHGSGIAGRSWQLVHEAVGVGLPNGEHDGRGTPIMFTHGEGPCIVRANPADVNGYRWFLFVDQPKYHGGPDHYICFASNDLDDPRGWHSVSARLRRGLPLNADGGMPRHGTVMPITAEERDHLIERLG